MSASAGPTQPLPLKSATDAAKSVLDAEEVTADRAARLAVHRCATVFALYLGTLAEDRRAEAGHRSMTQQHVRDAAVEAGFGPR